MKACFPAVVNSSPVVEARNDIDRTIPANNPDRTAPCERRLMRVRKSIPSRKNEGMNLKTSSHSGEKLSRAALTAT